MKLSKDKNLDHKALELIALLGKLNLNNLNLSDYNLEYAKRYLDRPKYNTYLSCFNVELAQPLRRFKTIIDLGGGIGMQSAFLSTLDTSADIIYLDVDPDSTESAKSIHHALGIEIASYHTGKLEDIADLVNKDTLILSRDVIEHIYDLRSFFILSSKAGLNVHNTAAILGSFFRNKEFAKIHEDAEFKGNSSENIKARDTKQSYFSIREDIIREMRPELNATELAIAVNQTRGLIKRDIEVFIERNEMPEFHKNTIHSNTCDPLTGNWAERTLLPEDYLLYASPLKLEFHYPKYNALDHKGTRAILMKALNIFASLPLHKIQPSFSIVY